VSAPHWVEIVGWISLGISFSCALAIAADELFGSRQQMGVMNLVHPITALYLGPVWLWAYVRNGRASSLRALHSDAKRLARQGADPDELERLGSSTAPSDLRPWHVGDAASHCGAGCTLGDIGGEWIVFAAGLTIAGETLYPELLLDFVLAWSLGIAFQYFTIVPMRDDVGALRGLWLAIRADTLSIVSFQIGLFGFMVLSAKVLWQPPLQIDSAAHWWMMQVGMVVGFVTAWPVNRWLVRRGWKEKMDRRTHLAMLVRDELGHDQEGSRTDRRRSTTAAPSSAASGRRSARVVQRRSP
jgi:hypothetical protein